MLLQGINSQMLRPFNFKCAQPAIPFKLRATRSGREFSIPYEDNFVVPSWHSLHFFGRLKTAGTIQVQFSTVHFWYSLFYVASVYLVPPTTSVRTVIQLLSGYNIRSF